MSSKVHVHLHGKSLARSRAFYKAFLGGDPVKERSGYLKFLPDFAPLNLAISEYASEAGAGSISHFGIQLDSTEEVLRHLARVKTSGIEVREEMGVDCCHANQDKFWVSDPDGNEWEVYHLNHDIDASAAVPIAATTNCCAPGSTGCASSPHDANVVR